MTRLQQSAIDHLFTGGYLFIRERKTNAKGKDFKRYTLYKGNKNPVRIYHERTLAFILKLCKQDAKGKYTLNLNLVRQQRKNTYVKALYLELKKEGQQQAIKSYLNETGKYTACIDTIGGPRKHRLLKLDTNQASLF